MAGHAFLFAAAPLFGPGSWGDRGHGVEALFFDSTGPYGIYGLERNPNGEVAMRAHKAPGDVHFADFAIFGSPFEVSAANPFEVVACLLTFYWKYPAHGTEHPRPIVSFRARPQEPPFAGNTLAFNPTTDYAIDPLTFSLTGNLQGEIPIPNQRMSLPRQSREEIQKEVADNAFSGVPYMWMLNGLYLPFSNILIRLSLNQAWSGSLWEPLGDRFTAQGWRQPDWVPQTHPDAVPLIEDPREMFLFNKHNDF